MKKLLTLFLAIYCLLALAACNKECKHQYQETITKEASCETIGVKTFTCSLCQDSYTEEIPMLEHDYTSEITSAPTCSQKGTTTFTCSLCNDTYTEDIAMIAHTWSDAVVIKEPSCATEGEKVADCTVCGAKDEVEKIAKVEHKYISKITKAASCAVEGTNTLTCSQCGDTKTETIAKLEHKYSSKVTAEPTCTAAGTKTLTCSGCGATKTESIAKLGHNYTQTETKPVTCAEDGERKSTCTRCNDSFTETIKAQGHTWSAATCTEAKKCTKCSSTEGSALGHNVQNGVCARCGWNIEVEKKAAIEEENKRHNNVIAKIEGYYDASISINERTIDSLKSQYGISYVSSASYYYNRQSSIQSEITNLSYKLAYSSSASEQARLQREINSLREELTEINICLRIIDLQDEIDYYESQRDIVIAQENRTHQQNLADIEAKYK